MHIKIHTIDWCGFFAPWHDATGHNVRVPLRYERIISVWGLLLVANKCHGAKFDQSFPFINTCLAIGNLYRAWPLNMQYWTRISFAWRWNIIASNSNNVQFCRRNGVRSFRWGDARFQCHRRACCYRRLVYFTNLYILLHQHAIFIYFCIL